MRRQKKIRETFVKDLLPQQRSLTSFLQGTPMKPSQVFFHPPPRRMLPLQNPEPCPNDRLDPPPPPRLRQGPIHSSGHVPVSPVNVGYSANKLHPPPRNRLDPVSHSAQPQRSSRSQLGPIGSTNSETLTNGSKPSLCGSLNPASPQLMKDCSNQSLPPHFRSDQSTQCEVTSFHSGIKNVTAAKQGSNKVIRHKQKPSSENQTSDLNHSSQKRRRETEDCNDGAKKVCHQGKKFGKAETPKPTLGSSLRTPLASQPLSGRSSVLAMSPKAPESHLCTEPACGELTHMAKSCSKKHPSMGVKQAYLNSCKNNSVTLTESLNPHEELLKEMSEEVSKCDKSLLSSKVPQKDSGSSLHSQSGSHRSGLTHCNTPVLPAKTLTGDNQQEKSKKNPSSTSKPASKQNSDSPNCRTSERGRTVRRQRSVAIPDDIDQLFTPDPISYVIAPGNKTVKSKTSGETSTAEEHLSTPVTKASSAVSGSLCDKAQNTKTDSSHAVDTKASSLSAASAPRISVPTIVLEKIKLNEGTFSPPNSSLKNSSEATNSCSALDDQGVKSDEKKKSPVLPKVGPRSLEPDCVSQQTSLSQSLPQASERDKKQVIEEDPIDVELDLDLSFALDLDLTQSSHSSEEEQLLSLQEMMKQAAKPPDTPEKGAFSEPSTPGDRSCQSKNPLPSTKSANYKNNLDQMLKDISTNKRAKEIEAQLLTACKEDLQRIAEYENAEENQTELINTEQQQFLQCYSLMSSAIREVPPGEVVFNLEKFGQIFNHDTLELRQCVSNSQDTLQKTLLMSSAAQLKLHVNIGMFQEVYDSHLPCPLQVTRFLFKMMSVHTERMVSKKILQALCDIAHTAAYQIVKNGSKTFKVWVPSLADVALVLMNMGAAFVTLFPFENLQPPFTEGDLLEDTHIQNEGPSAKAESTFPEHNYSNILNYLSYCMALCPRAYSDDELLLLLTVVGKVSLDTQFILQPSVELYPLQYKIICNIRDWNTLLPRICLAFADLTDDHHNMCLLVQLLPQNKLGKLLRRHLSLSMISKLLDGSCTYRPTETDIPLSQLRRYLPRMRPSTILQGMMSSSSRGQKDKDHMATLDQQAYYLCYSLLTLANEASNFELFPVHQKEQLLIMCSELETHVKCDIRESEKCLYRSKVKDLVARISTKWQNLLKKTRPLHNKLYHYWSPDTLTSSQGGRELDNRGEEEGPVMQELEEEETSGTEVKEVPVVSEDEQKLQGHATMMTEETGDKTKPEDLEDAIDEPNKTEDATVNNDTRG